ncbi:MAG: ribonuclease H-like YkuK family protein [Saprospiraceae bacterium]
MNWRTFSGQEINEPIAERVEHVIQSEIASGDRLKLCIGTDSRVIGHGIDFATVIVFLREGQGDLCLSTTAMKKGDEPQSAHDHRSCQIDTNSHLNCAAKLNITTFHWKFMQTSIQILFQIQCRTQGSDGLYLK